MNTSSPFCSINCSCTETVQWAMKHLTQAGLRALQTFDLNTARHPPEDCPCPQHGAHACDCQLVVLLIYGSVGEPVTLILHGNDGKTWVSIVDNPLQRADATLVTAIQQTLKMKKATLVSHS